MYIDFSYDFLTLPVIPHVVVIRNLNKIMFSDLFQKVCIKQNVNNFKTAHVYQKKTTENIKSKSWYCIGNVG